MALSNTVVIQDLIVVNQTPINTMRFEKSGSDEVASEQLIHRIHEHVKVLITEAASCHQNNFCDSDGKLKQECLNTITRLITNEFYFYTDRPLSLAEFESLQQKIMDVAKLQTENIHLVLASFSVKTPNGAVMNVTVHIECGSQASLHFIVKNNASIMDVNHYDKEHNFMKFINIKDARDGMMKNLYLDLFLKAPDEITPDELLSSPGVIIDKVSHPFSFNNVISCQTASGSSFNSCIDVCFDHFWGTGINNIRKSASTRINNSHQPGARNPDPNYISHVVTAWSIDLKPENTIGIVTHADPKYSPDSPKQGAAIQYKKDIEDPQFGIPASLIVTAPSACDHILRFAIEENNLPLVACLIQQGVDINASVRSGQQFLKPIEIAVNAQGCNLHVRSKLPTDLQAFNGSYIICMQNDSEFIPQNLYYILPGGIAENVTISDWELFKEVLSDIRKRAEMSIHLNNQQAEKLITSNGGHTPPNYLDIIDFMLDNGVDIHETNADGESLLHVAVQKNDYKLVTLLIKKGANLQQQNNNLETPFDFAIKHGHLKIANQLRKSILNELKSSDLPVSSILPGV